MDRLLGTMVLQEQTSYGIGAATHVMKCVGVQCNLAELQALDDVWEFFSPTARGKDMRERLKKMGRTVSTVSTTHGYAKMGKDVMKTQAEKKAMEIAAKKSGSWLIGPFLWVGLTLVPSGATLFADTVGRAALEGEDTAEYNSAGRQFVSEVGPSGVSMVADTITGVPVFSMFAGSALQEMTDDLVLMEKKREEQYGWVWGDLPKDLKSSLTPPLKGCSVKWRDCVTECHALSKAVKLTCRSSCSRDNQQKKQAFNDCAEEQKRKAYEQQLKDKWGEKQRKRAPPPSPLPSGFPNVPRGDWRITSQVCVSGMPCLPAGDQVLRNVGGYELYREMGIDMQKGLSRAPMPPGCRASVSYGHYTGSSFTSRVRVVCQQEGMSGNVEMLIQVTRI